MSARDTQIEVFVYEFVASGQTSSNKVTFLSKRFAIFLALFLAFGHILSALKNRHIDDFPS